MDIVTTGVHDAGRLGFIREISLLCNRQRIDVGADADGLLAVLAVDGGYHAVAGNVRCEFDANLFQAGLNAFCSFTFLFTQFRMHVEFSAEFHHFVKDVIHTGADFFYLIFHEFSSKVFLAGNK